jgi:hypothetical protein
VWRARIVFLRRLAKAVVGKDASIMDERRGVHKRVIDR